MPISDIIKFLNKPLVLYCKSKLNTNSSYEQNFVLTTTHKLLR